MANEIGTPEVKYRIESIPAYRIFDIPQKPAESVGTTFLVVPSGANQHLVSNSQGKDRRGQHPMRFTQK
jgi:hypothetical protein